MPTKPISHHPQQHKIDQQRSPEHQAYMAKVTAKQAAKAAKAAPPAEEKAIRKPAAKAPAADA